MLKAKHTLYVDAIFIMLKLHSSCLLGLEEAALLMSACLDYCVTVCFTGATKHHYKRVFMLVHPSICRSVMPSVLKVFWSTRCHVPGLVCLCQHMLDSIPFAVHSAIQFIFYLLKYMLLFFILLLCAQKVYSQAHMKFVLFRKQLCLQADSFLEQLAHN